MGRSARRLLGAAIALAAALVSAPAASADPHEFLAATDPLPTRTTISLTEGSEPEILRRVALTGRVPAPGPEPVGDGHGLPARARGRLAPRVLTDPVSGRYRTHFRLKGCCDYVAQARSGAEALRAALLRGQPARRRSSRAARP